MVQKWPTTRHTFDTHWRMDSSSGHLIWTYIYPIEERICQLYHQGVESKESYVCQCRVFYEIRGIYCCLFKQGFGPLNKVMEYEGQRCPGHFLLELKRHREKLLKDNSTATQPHLQRTLAICHARRPRPHGPRSHHPCHQQIKAIISRHRRCFPRFGDLSLLD